MHGAALFAWLASALVAAPAPPQEPGPAAPPPPAGREHEPDLLVLLRDPSGQPVAGARGMLRGRGGARLPALADCVAAGRDEPWLSGTSDARGVLRFAPPPGTGTPGAAAGIVWTEDGLGALVVELYAGRAQRLTLAPMAELVAADGDAPLHVQARAHLPGGVTVLPFVADGPRVRLPAADYELWVRRGDVWTWQRRRLRSAERTELSFAGPTLRLVPDAATTSVHPAGRPDVRLATGASPATLLGDAATAPLLALRDGVVHGPAIAPLDGDATWPWPHEDASPRTLVPLDLPADAPRSVTVWSLLRTPAGSWRVLGVATPRPGPGRSQRLVPSVALPSPPDGDVWQLLTAEGHAPSARPWREARDEAPIALERGVAFAVACRDEQGLPLVDVAVDYEPDGMAPARVAARTDAFGVAHLGRVLGPGRLQVSDARYANQTIGLQTIPTEPLAVTVAAGEHLHGVARWPDGTPASSVVVTLRDPTGALRPAERAVVAGEDGSFQFAGLTRNRGLVLFASAKRDGRTWSGKLDRLLPGGGTIDLVVRDEDPQLLPR